MRDFGYEGAAAQAPDSIPDPLDSEKIELKKIEDQAHSKKVLLSSDAIRYFKDVTKDGTNRTLYLDRVLGEARVSYPAEDGWIVLNLERMQELCQHHINDEKTGEELSVEIDDDMVAPEQKEAKQLPEAAHGASSLAEAIVTGNVAASYEMIGNRPMFALADAAADLDAAYRMKKGESVAISDLLEAETTKLSAEQLQAAIAALTGALDGTYTDEASAVKMAILKAVKATD
ncbi:hypothetical protein N9L26_02650 [Candidatus Pacebacteria bacterium]|nr:hypothetical protein [Candidatus Paceibacterota bacterium]